MRTCNSSTGSQICENFIRSQRGDKPISAAEELASSHVDVECSSKIAFFVMSFSIEFRKSAGKVLSGSDWLNGATTDSFLISIPYLGRA